MPVVCERVDPLAVEAEAVFDRDALLVADIPSALDLAELTPLACEPLVVEFEPAFLLSTVGVSKRSPFSGSIVSLYDRPAAVPTLLDCDVPRVWLTLLLRPAETPSPMLRLWL
jgi:hypothetical protein